MVLQVDGRTLAGDYSQAIGKFGEFMDRNRQKRDDKETLSLAENAMADGILDAKELITLSQRDPKAAQALFQLDQQKRSDKLQELQAKNAANFNETSALLNMSSTERKSYLTQQAVERQQKGEDISRDLQLLNMDDDQLIASLRKKQIDSGDFDKLFKAGVVGKQKDTRTSQQKDYELAASQGYEGSFIDYQKELKKSGATSITNNVNNNSDLTRSQKTANQKKVLLAKRDLVSLRKVKDRIKPEIFNTFNRAKNNISNSLEKFGFEKSEQSKQFNKDLESVITPVRQYFNRYRKEITGAAAAVQELEALKNATINENLSYSQFTDRLEQIIQIAEADMDGAKEALREGVDASPAPTESQPLSDEDLFKKYGIK